MPAVNLRVIRPDEPSPTPRRPFPWRRVLGIAGLGLWWTGLVLWQVTKAVVVVTLVLVSVTLMVIGVLSHFVGGPPR